jgi:hypothetical protein
MAYVICGTCLGCAGYQIGNRSLFRGDIRSVHVSIFESDSHRRFLGQQLTEAVVKQIEQDTPLIVADASTADSFLTGRILSELKRPRTLDRFGERSGVPLIQRQELQINDDIEFIPEGGQSLSTAQRELINRLARQIVGQLETGW